MNSRSEILLSILIPSIPRRLPKLTTLLENLSRQADPRLEVLVLMDNQTRHVGSKRNALMDMAAGKYLMHCDDDDSVSPVFFRTLEPHLIFNDDLIAYDAAVSFNGSPEFRVTTEMGAPMGQPHHLPGGRFSDITRPPWHWSAWRTEFARQFRFPDHFDGAEDWYFLQQALPAVKNFKKIPEILFYHRYSNKDSTFG